MSGDQGTLGTVDGFPDPATDPTAALLRDVLARQAAAVQPSPDGLDRIRAAISAAPPLQAVPDPAAENHAADDSAADDPDGPAADDDVTPMRPPTLPAGPGDRPRPRSWGTVLAAAASVVLLLGTGGFVADHLRLFANNAPDATTAGSSTTGSDDEDRSVRVSDPKDLPVYVVGSLDRSGRTEYRLFVEYRPTTASTLDARLSAALTEAITRRPDDEDFVRVFGGAGSTRVNARWDEQAGEVVVVLNSAMTTVRRAADARADIAIQQIVWTANAVLGREVPVRITVKQPAMDSYLFGRPSYPLGGRFFKRHGADDPLSPVWLVDPADGTTLGRAQDAFGVQVGYAARDGVTWTLYRNNKQVSAGIAEVGFPVGRDKAAPGSRGTASIEVDHRQPGVYELVVSEPDTAPLPRWSDSKTFVVN